MSRRKQANPRPVKSVGGGGDGVSHGEEEEPTVTVINTETDRNPQSPELSDHEEPLTINTNLLDNEDSPPSEPSNHTSPVHQSSSSSIKAESFSGPPSEAESSCPPSPSIPSSSVFPGHSFSITDSRCLKRAAKVNGELKILPVSGKDGKPRFICPVCSDEMGTLHELTVHIRQHNTAAINSTSANCCTICGKVLSSQSSLDRHMLVHSGERPFTCHICHMSFTTNGNMHRHARIHNKDSEMGLGPGSKGGARRGKGGWRPKPNLDLTSHETAPRYLPETPPSFAFRPMPTVEMPIFTAGKRTASEDWPGSPSPIKKVALVSDVHQELPLNPKSELPKVEEDREDFPRSVSKNEMAEKHKCPVCDQVFLSQSLFESHIDSHPNIPVLCHVCQMSLPSPRGLVSHTQRDHPWKMTEVKTEPTSVAEAEDISVGFHDLDFIDFTCAKFPLVAKARCECSTRKPSSIFHEFVCTFCKKSFPCKSALLLHSPIHTDTQLTSCPFCDCEFVDQDIMQTHMVKHMSERALEDSHASDLTSVSQQDFLAVFDLAPRQLVKKKGLSSKIAKIEKRENNDYFPKLGHAFVPSNPVISLQQTDPKVSKEVEDLKRFFPANTLLMPEGIHFSHLAALRLTQLHQQLCRPFLALPQQPQLQHPMSASSPLGTTKQSDSPFPGESPISTPPAWEESHGDSETKGKGIFPCKYCDVVFTNQRSLKGHTRTHLGLSPYKCNLCDYSSADKSTLIRHLRTHNGERPFQCLICDFAFTTKANCERHVRKKHNKGMKDEIEQSIGYNKYVMDTTSSIDAFHSPDTVCKYCGVDFKFFRALKHHLRSHSSCRQKPFQCQKCNVGFSTKANCVRHIQKQHLEVSQQHIEGMIHVSELSLLEDDRGASDSQDSTSPASLSGTGSQVSPSPPAAHKVEHTSMLVKLEPTQLSCNQPLDFSVQRSSFTPSPVLNRGDEPMDLSMKKRSPSPKLVYDRPVKMSPETAECYYKLSCKVSDKNNNDKTNWNSEHSQREPPKISLLSKFALHSSNTDSTSDLASVHKILNNTGSHRFNMFLGSTSDVEKEDTITAFRNQFLASRNMGSPKESPALSTESDVALLAQSYREEEWKNEEDEDHDEEESGFIDDSLVIDKSKMELEENMAMNGMMLDAQEKADDQADDKLDTPIKKKRNSYADSPHKLACPYCPRSFPWVSSLNRHLLTHTGQKPFKCPRCPVTFSTKSNRERHLIRKHGVNMLDPASRQTMDRPYKCHLCVFSSFSTESNLLKHYHERHNGVNPEPVVDGEAVRNLLHDGELVDNEDSNLENSFSDEDSSLQTPGKSVDNLRGTSPAESMSDMSQTDIADYSAFIQSQNPTKAEGHGDQGHGDEEDCDELSDSVSVSIGSGERQINPERDNYNVDKITNCWKCGKTFPSRKILVRHLKEHNIDLPFKCYLCDASYDNRKECLLHQEKHHGRDWAILKEKNSVDDIDPFSVRMDQLVDRHVRVGNGIPMEEEEEEAGEELVENVTADYSQRKVYCSLCPKRFWSLQDLRRHMRSHTGERPFECNVCHKRFTLKHSMMRHRKKHLPGANNSPALSDDEDQLPNEDASLLGSSRGRSALRYHLTNNKRDASPGFSCDTPPTMTPKHKFVPINKDDDDDDDDILHNLLGVDESAINSMLDSADSAAQMLGVKRTNCFV